MSRTSLELVAKDLNMFKYFVRFVFRQNIRANIRELVARLSHDVRASVVNLSPLRFRSQFCTFDFDIKGQCMK